MTPVKWVDGFYDAPEDMPQEMLGPNLEVIPVAVIPLADLEAWLSEQRAWQQKYTDEYRPVYDDLLAQVQAWKTSDATHEMNHTNRKP
jgi:hypothetical protein